jgi:hypothetical protein
MDTTVVLVAASLDNGILAGCPSAELMSTELDDRSFINLRDGTLYMDASIAHASVGEAPLSMFNGENGDGTWTLHVSDQRGRHRRAQRVEPGAGECSRGLLEHRRAETDPGRRPERRPLPLDVSATGTIEIST